MCVHQRKRCTLDMKKSAYVSACVSESARSNNEAGNNGECGEKMLELVETSS